MKTSTARAIPPEYRQRVSQAAHRAAIRFELDERVRLLGRLRELMRTGVSNEAIEVFFTEIEEGEKWGVER
jgi:hypothetical protein